MNRRTKGALLTLLGGICWGLSGSCGQFLFRNEGMTTNWLVPIRLGCAGIVLLAFSMFRYGRTSIIAPWQEKQDRVDLLIYGILGVSCCQYLYFLTIQLSSAGIATILQDLSPVMILAATCILTHRTPSKLEIFSIMLAFIGVILITTHGSFSNLAVPAEAILTGCVSAVCVTIYNMEPARIMKKYPVSVLQGWAFMLGSVLFSIIFQPWNVDYTPSLIGILGIIFVVMIGNVLAFTAYMKGVSMIGPELGILYGFSEPVTAAVITTLFMGSVFTIWDALGFGAVFAMLALISYGEKRQAAQQVKNEKKPEYQSGFSSGGK